MSPHSTSLYATQDIRHIKLSYDNADSDATALKLVFALDPTWEHDEGQVHVIRFTDGITNTLLKAEKRRRGYTQEQVDNEAILLRAYGKGTEVLIDRESESCKKLARDPLDSFAMEANTKWSLGEAISHSLLAQHDLAPPLLARFQNGLLYKFMRGQVCTPEDLRREPVWRGVAQNLGEWHGVLPVTSPGESDGEATLNLKAETAARKFKESPRSRKINSIAPTKTIPTLWTVLQKWILALPAGTEADRKRRDMLQDELDRIVIQFGNIPGLGDDGLVLGHCDLLSGNVIIRSHDDKTDGVVTPVSFIDYEYTTPVPAAFDIANHFAEWGGFACDYSVLPTRSQRRAFITEYLRSYSEVADPASFPMLSDTASTAQNAAESEAGLRVYARQLHQDVDDFRGLPGFYWGIWALIQATISQIDFDYASYAELRLAEYFDWRAEEDGSRASRGEVMPPRERRWAQEE
ncbi:MAG: hypothetical protein Q9195_003898 [Heterodermia aff. obscurata]